MLTLQNKPGVSFHNDSVNDILLFMDGSLTSNRSQGSFCYIRRHQGGSKDCSFLKTKQNMTLHKRTKNEMAVIEDMVESTYPLENEYQFSDEDILDIVKSCMISQNDSSSLQLHLYITMYGLDSHPVVGNYLVSNLAESGKLCEARRVFDKLAHPDNQSSNSLIRGYIKLGEMKHAFDMYDKMQGHDSFQLSHYTYADLLKICAEKRNVEMGSKIHSDIAKMGLLETNTVLGNAVVSMYIKCNSLTKAQQTFDGLYLRNVVTWNALIAGYANTDQGDEALKRFGEMKKEGIPPNAITFICILKACSSLGDIQTGQETHIQLLKRGLLQSDIRIICALVDMYAKNGCLLEAQAVFDKFPSKNIVVWTSIIVGYVEHGYAEKALSIFENMVLQGICPDSVSFICVLKACRSIGNIDKGQEVHAEIARQELLKNDSRIGNSLVDMYASCGFSAKAEEVFDEIQPKDIVSWTILISAYSENGEPTKALGCYEKMKTLGFSPNAVTVISVLKTCLMMKATDKIQEMHSEITVKGFLEKDIVVVNTLVDAYGKCGMNMEAQFVFDRIQIRNVVSWTALISGYVEGGLFEEALNCFSKMRMANMSPDAVTYICVLKAMKNLNEVDLEKIGEIHTEIDKGHLLERNVQLGNALMDVYVKHGLIMKAQQVFDRMTNRNVVSWTTIITGYCQQECAEKAIELFATMQQKGVCPDAATYISVLKACGLIGAKLKGQELHSEISRNYIWLLKSDIALSNAVIDMYCKCGSLDLAQEVFDELAFHDDVLWSTIISGYAQMGESEKVFHIYDRMVREGVRPNLVTFTSVLTACCHTGLVDKGLMYFEVMNKDFGLVPTVEHYTCLLDLLGRAGQLDKVLYLINRIPWRPDPIVWLTIMGACQKWGNVELATEVFKHSSKPENMHSATYITMSNIYVDAYLYE